MDPALEYAVGLGSNLGDRLGHLGRAVAAMREIGRVVAVSSLYESEPIGPRQPPYLNAAALLRTRVAPRALLVRLQQIEHAAGRERPGRWLPRTLDLDILWVADLIVRDADLTVPHPLLSGRAFALVPLLELVPGAADPQSRVPYSRSMDTLRAQDVRRVMGPQWACGCS